MRSVTRRHLGPLACALLLAGCASHASDLAKIRESLVQGDIDQAVSEFEKKDFKESDLLYLLERGHMLHMAGRWEESNQAFEMAERRAEDLYTKSIARQAASLLTSDLSLPYRGVPHELQFVQYYRALNYLNLHEPQEALVEARKANLRLARWAETEQGAPFRQDAFLQYFTGLLYESEREVNDAIVSFRDAAARYREYSQEYGFSAPSWLPEDYLAAAWHLGLEGDVDSLLANDSGLAERAAQNDDNNVVVIFESGFVPYRIPVDIVLPVYESGHDTEGKSTEAHNYVDRYGDDIYAYRKGNVKLDKVLRFSFPELLDVPSQVAHCEFEAAGMRFETAEFALDLAAVARADFTRRIPGILLKTIARALAKEGVRGVAEESDETLGWIVNVFNVATEQADTRGWVLLPGRYHILKTHLDPGRQIVRAHFLDPEGNPVDILEQEVEILPGRTCFLAFRSFH